MKSIWPAATLAILVTGYFAWSNYAAPVVQQTRIEDCHRLAGEVEAIHGAGDTIPADLLASARACSISFGQNWAATGGDSAAQWRAEGAARVQ